MDNFQGVMEILDGGDELRENAARVVFGESALVIDVV